MNNVKSKHLTIGLIGLITVALTFCLYFLLDIERTTLRNWAFSFFVFAELLFFIGFNIITSTKLFNDALSRAGMISLLTLYLIVMLISMLLSGWIADTQRTLILVIVIIHGVFIILLVLFYYISFKFLEEGKNLRQKATVMDYAERAIYGILAKSGNKKYASLLTRVYEQIKYADKNGTSSQDEAIISQVDTIKLNSETDTQEDMTIISNIEQLSILLHKRKEELSELKRGGF